MSITKRKNSWQVSVMHEGKRIRRDFKDLYKAQMFELTAKADLIEGREPVKKKEGIPTTFGGMANHIWKLEWSRQKSADHTFNRMLKVIDHFGDDRDVSDITSYDLEAYVLGLRSEGNGPATINRKIAIAGKVFNYAHRHGLIKIKPTVAKQREPNGRMKFYSKEDELKILEDLASEPDLQDFFAVLIDTGMRRGEALSVEWFDVNFTANQINLSDPDMIKTSLPRSIPMTKRVADILYRRLSDNLEWPFPFTSSVIDHTLAKLRRKGLLSSVESALFHTCRHTFISRLIQKGVPLVTVKTLAGHRSIQTTMRYAHLAPNNMTDAVLLLEES
tara:strand:+ start:3402 stop:4397 length:996 start_codon:yes stop_codon:yes gene_type:complete